MIMWKRNSQTAFVAMALVTSIGLAEEPVKKDHATGAGAGSQPPAVTESGAIRPPGSGSLRNQEVELVSYFFSQPKSFIANRFSTSLPEAVTGSRNGKPEGLSKTLAELMGTLNDKQRDAVYAKSKELKSAKTLDDVKDPYLKSVLDKVFTDGDFRELTDKMYLAISVLKGKTGEIEKKTAEDKKFIEMFGKDFDEQLKKNKDVTEAIAKATDPSATDETKKKAKDFLRSEVNRDAVMAFLDGQRLSGNKKGATDLAEALSWEQKDANNKVTGKFLDFNATNAAGQTEMQRLLLGTSKTDIDNALKAYSSTNAFRNNAGLHGVSLSSSAFPTPQRIVSYDPQANGGKGGLVDQTPAAVAATPTPQTGVPQTQNQTPTAGGNPPARTGEQAPPPRVAQQQPGAGAETIIAQKCNNCHGSGPSATTGPISGAKAALERINLGSGPKKMPKNGTLTTEELASLRAYYSAR